MWTLWQDVRYSARLLVKHPGFSLTAIGVLMLGIGVNAGIFTIINGLLIRPLAGADAPGEVVPHSLVIGESFARLGGAEKRQARASKPSRSAKT